MKYLLGRRRVAIVTLLAGLFVVVVAPQVAWGEVVADDCRAAYYSPSSVQHPGMTIHSQNVYAVPSTSSPAGDVFPASFVSYPMQIDAVQVLSGDSMLFSVDRNGYIPTPSGLVFVKRGDVYVATNTEAGVEVELDPDWDDLGLNLQSLDALHRDATGCYSFSVSRLNYNPDGPYLRKWQAHRKCPGAPIELVFNAISGLGVSDVDALHIDGDTIEFSSTTNRYLAGGVRIWNQDTQRCVPAGAARSCTPAG